jgi:hypothetical protein
MTTVEGMYIALMELAHGVRDRATRAPWYEMVVNMEVLPTVVTAHSLMK